MFKDRKRGKNSYNERNTTKKDAFERVRETQEEGYSRETRSKRSAGLCTWSDQFERKFHYVQGSNWMEEMIHNALKAGKISQTDFTTIGDHAKRHTRSKGDIVALALC